MRPLPIDFLRSGVERARIGPWVQRIVIGLCLSVTVFQGFRGWQAREEANDLRQQAHAAEAAVSARAAAAAQVRPPYFEDAMRLAAAAAFDAGKVLANVESVQQAGVRLRSITVDAFAANAAAEFEVEDLASLAPVMDSMNGGGSVPAWEVVSGEAARDGRAGSLRVQGSWKHSFSRN